VNMICCAHNANKDFSFLLIVFAIRGAQKGTTSTQTLGPAKLVPTTASPAMLRGAASLAATWTTGCLSLR
jgi:hypothetical protein